jgi:hypothetical protein
MAANRAIKHIRDVIVDLEDWECGDVASHSVVAAIHALYAAKQLVIVARRFEQDAERGCPNEG